MQHSQKIISDNKQLFYAWFSAMYTRVDLIFCSEAERKDLKDIAQNISDQIDSIESMANRFNEGSELSKLNAGAYENEMSVSEELFGILVDCQMYHQQSLGYFDVTVNSKNDYRNGVAALHLNPDKQTICFLHPDVQLDLSGYIKGYALRAVKQLLEKEYITDALVSMGNSSVLALGNHPFGKGWKVSRPETDAATSCVLFDECLTTSGNNVQTKWPVLNPLSGKAVEEKSPVSVITDDPAVGEVLSTALYVADEERKAVLLKRFNAKELRVEN
ncbi:MAG: FAD:protein FMN transferase [Paludibacter sp.]|nr:FAD:protein FMN transferase [Paludibacter sp.]